MTLEVINKMRHGRTFTLTKHLKLEQYKLEQYLLYVIINTITVPITVLANKTTLHEVKMTHLQICCADVLHKLNR